MPYPDHSWCVRVLADTSLDLQTRQIIIVLAYSAGPSGVITHTPQSIAQKHDLDTEDVQDRWADVLTSDWLDGYTFSAFGLNASGAAQ